jgi:hypothetical protein
MSVVLAHGNLRAGAWLLVGVWAATAAYALLSAGMKELTRPAPASGPVTSPTLAA